MIKKALRIIIGIALAYGLIHFTLRSTGGDVWTEILQADKTLLLLTLLFFAVTSISLPVYRWHLLLKVQGIHLQVRNLIRLTLIGNFFNMALPGAISGDVVKMIYVTKQAEEKRTEAVLTVILDRTLGLLGLLILATVMVALYLPFLFELKEEFRPIQVAAIMVCMAGMGGILGLVLLWFRQSIQRCLGIEKIITFITGKLPQAVMHSLNRLIKAFDLYRQSLQTIVIGMLLSLLIHASLAIILLLIGISVGEKNLTMGDYFLATQVSSAIAIIPLTPGGIGVRDVTIAVFFNALQEGAEKIGVIPVIMTLMTVFLRLLGGGVFIFSKFPRSAVQGAVAGQATDSFKLDLE